uniref:Uncharacterized protein n=1 Tax=Oryza sativa subsp. japonica TaxID=39947 RepID=Q5Z5K1_ORYSJ|nr:hypothetical protein [Oryza sativa Japonica Group]
MFVRVRSRFVNVSFAFVKRPFAFVHVRSRSFAFGHVRFAFVKRSFAAAASRGGGGAVRRRGGPAAWGHGGGGPRRRHGGPASASRERETESYIERERGRGLSPKRRGGGICGGGGEDRQATVRDDGGEVRGCPRQWRRRRSRCSISMEKRLSVGGEDEGAPGIYIPRIFTPSW